MTPVSRFTERFGVPAALIAVAAVWGSTFVVVADTVARYPMFAFLSWRFGIATVAFAVLFPRALKRLNRANLTAGLAAGVLLAAGYIFQTWGLAPGVGTTPARAAFITGLYVVAVPLLQAVIMRRMPRKSTILGAVLALAGLWLLSGVGTVGAWVTGDTLVLICALAYSFHMIALGMTDDRHDTIALTVVQLATVAVVTGAISLGVERVGPPTDPWVWASIVFTGVIASALAFMVQTWAGRTIPPSRVALILVMEPAFGGLFGWAVAGNAPMAEVAGAALMLGGMIVSEAVAALAPARAGVEYEAAVEGPPVAVAEGGDRVSEQGP